MKAWLKAILAFASVAGLSFIGVFYAQGGNFTSLLQPIQPFIDTVKTRITNIQSTWASIPVEVKGLITLAIPSGLALFFAWTKTRAMQKLQQTQLQAQQKFNQMNGEASQAEAQIKLLTQDKLSLQQQIGTQSNLGFEDLMKSRDEAQQLLATAQSNMRDMRIDYEARIRELQEDLDRLKLKTQIIIK